MGTKGHVQVIVPHLTESYGSQVCIKSYAIWSVKHLFVGGISFFCTYRQSINQSKFYLKSVHFITIQHKLSRAFQTDMHNKIT